MSRQYGTEGLEGGLKLSLGPPLFGLSDEQWQQFQTGLPAAILDTQKNQVLILIKIT